ncbi:S8/S53 family peptidase [Planotetraspora phitsanulokensis]|uniref:Protease n=1 Tax=Planotetraspora phitsanulokensis TaxID=575192 RepID=A0A8J3UDD9_9ACTN|nr:S8/S53 family peptidase [Planotetraspora phitsanulokensis]GII36975.1 protease [Planotetraspora phitsanulokensis]
MAPNRFREQFEVIRRAFADDPVDPVQVTMNEPEGLVYEKTHIITRGDDVEQVLTLLNERLPRSRRRMIRNAADPDTQPSDTYRIQVGDPAEETDDDGGVTEALNELRAERSAHGSSLATMNHVVSITNVNCCPADEPDTVRATGEEALNPGIAPRIDSEETVEILVIDTGLVSDYRKHSWIAAGTGEPAVPDFFVGGRPRAGGSLPDIDVGGAFKPQETSPDGTLLQYVGHGTFILGLIRAVAPTASVYVHNALRGAKAGAILENDLGNVLFGVIAERGWPDILSLSAGTGTADQAALKGLEHFMERLRQTRTLLVAAAGNDGLDRRFHPAAYAGDRDFRDAVVSVGALRNDGDAKGACFTNYGPWVRVYAPGERLTSALTGVGEGVPYVYQHSTFDCCRYLPAEDAYEDCICQLPGHTGVLSTDPPVGSRTEFTGLARWSGTSFATPIVAAMIANHMLWSGERNPREAAKDLLATRHSHAKVRGRDALALIPETWRPFDYTPTS